MNAFNLTASVIKDCIIHLYRKKLLAVLPLHIFDSVLTKKP